MATAAVLAYGRWLRDAKMYERLLKERASAPKGEMSLKEPSHQPEPQ